MVGFYRVHTQNDRIRAEPMFVRPRTPLAEMANFDFIFFALFIFAQQPP